MAYKPQSGDITSVMATFENERTILTQQDIREETGMSQEAVSATLCQLERAGRVMWERAESIRKVKFYTRSP